MSAICIIPARGGSKRIPRKNIKDFLGKPIIAYSIETAINSNLFDEVMVSTDDVEIAEVAKKYGAKVPFFRSKETSDDYATTFQVVEEVLNQYESINRTFDQFCCMYACSPLISKQRLKECQNLLLEHTFSSVFPVLEYSSPISRALIINESQKVEMIQTKNINSRTQDLSRSYFDAGQFYWGITKNIMSEKTIITKNSGAIILSELEAQDIDQNVDWCMAELKYQLKNKTL
ncbi:MAG: pseudaminic acid cytidylyltransferase [Flavobacteriales bacterium]